MSNRIEDKARDVIHAGLIKNENGWLIPDMLILVGCLAQALREERRLAADEFNDHCCCGIEGNPDIEENHDENSYCNMMVQKRLAKEVKLEPKDK